MVPLGHLFFFSIHSYFARANSIRAHARFVRGPGPPTKSQSSVESSLPLTPVYGLSSPTLAHLCPPTPTYLHSPFKPDAWRTKILAVQSPVPCHLWPLIVCRSAVHPDRHRLTAWIGRARTRWGTCTLFPHSPLLRLVVYLTLNLSYCGCPRVTGFWDPRQRDDKLPLHPFQFPLSLSRSLTLSFLRLSGHLLISHDRLPASAICLPHPALLPYFHLGDICSFRPRAVL